MAYKDFNASASLISQYANSPALTALIDRFESALDPEFTFNQFYDLIWNIATAQGFGLDNWGSIIGVSRYLVVIATVEYFGFEDSAHDWEPFGQGPFWVGSATSSAFALSDDLYRKLLYAKAYANISRLSVPVLNRMLMTVFGDSGRASVQDLSPMNIAYVFDFTLSPVQQAIVETSGVFPHPTGVAVQIVQAPGLYGIADIKLDAFSPA